MRWWWLALLAACGPSGRPGKDGSPGGDSGDATNGGTAGGSTTGAGPTAGSLSTGGTTAAATVVLGNGASSHAPLVAGQVVTMVHGPQQGWHVDVSGEVTGLGAIVGVEVSVLDADDGSVLGDNHNATFLQLAGYDDAATSGWFAGERAFLEGDQAAICALDQRPIELCAVVEDLAAPGVYAEGCVAVVLAIDPADQATCDALTP